MISNSLQGNLTALSESRLLSAVFLCISRHLQCHTPRLPVDPLVIRKVNTTGSLQQSCFATSTHPLVSRRSTATASTFRWPSIQVVEHYSLYKHWTCVREGKSPACNASGFGNVLEMTVNTGQKKKMIQLHARWGYRLLLYNANTWNVSFRNIKGVDIMCDSEERNSIFQTSAAHHAPSRTWSN